MGDPKSKIKRLGVMGGSFDPVHIAHLIVAECAREALGLDLVLFVPAGAQPFKADRVVTPAEHRLAMLERAIEGNPHFAVSKVDVERPGPSYTAQTIELLRQEWGGAGIGMWFIMGADSLAAFPSWRDPERILSLARLAVVRRPGPTLDITRLGMELPQLEGRVDWVDAPLMEISATEIRRRVAHARSIRYRVHEAVRAYIEANNLYQER